MPARVAGSFAVRVVRALVRTAGLSAAFERVPRVLRVDARDFAAAERVAGLFAVRIERAVSALAVVLRVVPVDARFGPRAPVADFTVRAAPVRAVLVRAVLVRAVLVRAVRAGAFRVAVAVVPVREVRVVAVRPDAARTVVRPAAARLVTGAAFARVVRFGAAALADAAACALVVREVVARAGALVVRVPFAAGLAALVVFADLAPSFLAAADRVDAVAPVRMVRAVLPRAPEPAVRRPPARAAMARVRLPSVVSLLMIETLCLVEMMARREDRRSLVPGTGPDRRRTSRSAPAIGMQHAGLSCSGRAVTSERINRQNANSANRHPMTHDQTCSSLNRIVLSTKSNRYTKVP